MRNVGINLNAMEGLSDEEYIRYIASLGFNALFTGSRLMNRERLVAIANTCAANGIAFETMHAPYAGINNIWSADESGDAMLAELIACVDNCAVVNVPIAVVHLSSGDNAPSITDAGRARFAKLAEHADKKGVRLAFENQRKLANLAWALETFPDAGFCWDCGHENCFTPGRQYMPLFSNRLICTHIHDNAGILNQDLHLLPFDGTSDFARIANQLHNSPFEGTLMMEVFAASSKNYETVSVTDYLDKAYAAVTRLAKMVE